MVRSIWFGRSIDRYTSAENGCFIKPRPIRGKDQDWINMVANYNMTWKTPCLEILGYVCLYPFGLGFDDVEVVDSSQSARLGHLLLLGRLL